jgi:hypothetical protein
MDTGFGSGILRRSNSSVHGVVRQYDEIGIDQSFHRMDMKIKTPMNTDQIESK